MAWTHNKRNKFSVSSKEDRTVDGIVFHSKAEAKRYGELKLLEKAGKIRDLRLQPKWDIVMNGIKCGTYSADFWYVDCADGSAIVEDVKGAKTQMYNLKKKLIEAQYGFVISDWK